MTSSRARRLRRKVSLLLVLLACFSTSVEDLFALIPCGEDGGYAPYESEASALGKMPDSHHSPRADTGNNDHDCLCCCHHIVMGSSFRLTLVCGITFLESRSTSKVPSVDLFPLCLPPRA